MKKYLILLVIPFILFSCTNNEKYYGEWIMLPIEPDNYAENIIITKDSISITSFPFLKTYSERLKLSSSKLELFGEKFDISLEYDSILYFNGAKYYKKEYFPKDHVIEEKIITLEYPKIKNIDTVQYETISSIYFGKKPNSNEFALQLNERIAPIQDIRFFLYTGHFPEDKLGISFVADKDSKMKDINDIFNECKYINARKLKLVNDINYYVDDKNNILTNEEGVFISLSYLAEENLIKKENDPPKNLVPWAKSLKTVASSFKCNIISLIKNELYFDAQKVSKNDLSKLIIKNYSTENNFIVLYDDVSNFEHYLALMNITNKSIHKIRNKESIKILKKPLDSLTQSDWSIIKSNIPKNLINGISFNDFKKLNIKIPELELVN